MPIILDPDFFSAASQSIERDDLWKTVALGGSEPAGQSRRLVGWRNSIHFIIRIGIRRNARQAVLATHNFESAFGALPTTWLVPQGSNSNGADGWSVQAQILPFLEQGNLFDNINFNLGYGDPAQPLLPQGDENILLAAFRVGTYLCPSEIRDEVRRNASGTKIHYPLNYAANLGDWFVWDPATQVPGNGCLVVKDKLPMSAIFDGTSNTMMYREVKA